MHHALVFSTSNTAPSTESQRDAPTPPCGTADDWLRGFAAEISPFGPDRSPIWLDPGCAAEIICIPGVGFDARTALDSPLFQTLRQKANAAAIDVNILPVTGRRKQLLIADMDSTVITSESLDDLAEMAGIGDAVAAITKRSMAGEIDFEEALETRVAMLAGKPASMFDQLVKDAVLTDGAATLVRTMRAHGAKSYLVSGGFDFITGPIAALCGFDGDHANHMNSADGKIIGTVTKPVLDRDAKAGYLADYCAAMQIDASNAATIGDGANDLAMLEAAGMGVAFHGKPLLREKIALQLNHTDLRGLLYLQGYKKADFTDH